MNPVDAPPHPVLTDLQREVLGILAQTGAASATLLRTRVSAPTFSTRYLQRVLGHLRVLGFVEQAGPEWRLARRDAAGPGPR